MATLTSTLLQQQEQVETGSGRLSDDDHEAVGSDSAIDDNRSQYSLKYPAYVVIFNLIMFIALLSSAVFSKTAFVSIALRLRINSTYAGADSMSHNYKRQSVAFVQLVLILCVPQIATFIKCLLFGALKSRKGHPWPLLCSLIMVSCNCQWVGACMFHWTFKILLILIIYLEQFRNCDNVFPSKSHYHGILKKNLQNQYLYTVASVV